jgi:hypothetical protein
MEICFTARPYQWAGLSRKFRAVTLGVERRFLRLRPPDFASEQKWGSRLSQSYVGQAVVVLEGLAGDNRAASPPGIPANQTQDHSQLRGKSASEDEDDWFHQIPFVQR